MRTRTLRAVTVSVAVLAALSCSKTSDTAPERRVFGDPPTIQNVAFDFNPASHVSCDFSKLVLNYLCDQGAILDAQFQPGPGCTLEAGKCTPAASPSAAPGVFIQGTYSEAIFKVTVSDPQSVPGGKNDILLVSSSFTQPPPSKTETSLVLFDDGSSLKFPNAQRAGAAESCTIDLDTQTCSCSGAKYDVVSGDQTANDGTYTRRFAMPNKNDNNFFLDCIMQTEQDGGHAENVAIPFDPGTQFNFKIEAVDREGNLATWPTRLPGTTGVDTFECNGDPCGCCLLQSANPTAECAGLDGVVSPSMAPNGVCHLWG